MEMRILHVYAPKGEYIGQVRRRGHRLWGNGRQAFQDRRGSDDQGIEGEFRPWYSDEEIAAQERKKVIDAISDVLIETERMSSYTDVATHLYESGLRFVEEDK